MKLEEFEKRALALAKYPNRGNPVGREYPALGLVGEIGEVSEHAKKVLRDDGGKVTEARRLSVLKEIGDVLWYCAAMNDEIGELPLASLWGQGNFGLPLARRDTFGNLVLGMAAAAGRIATIVSGLDRVGGPPVMLGDDDLGVLRSNLWNVISRVAKLAEILGSSLEEVAAANVAKLESRHARGVLGGSGSDR